MAEGKHTPGPVKATRAKHPDNTGGYDYAVSDQDNCIIAECFQHVGYAGGTAKQYIEFPAAENAALIAEAFNVATETGLTTRQILDLANKHREQAQVYLEQRSELLEALRGASHALRSYHYGNASTDLAQQIADRCGMEAKWFEPRRAVPQVMEAV